MADYNRVILLGNLTRDPEARYTQAGQSVCKFGLAVNRRYKAKDEQREETCFVDCVAWGKTAETIDRYLSKGRAILVEGRLQFSQWEDKNGGGKRSKLEVVVESFQFIGGRGSAGEHDSLGLDEPDMSKGNANPPKGGADDFDGIPF